MLIAIISEGLEPSSMVEEKFGKTPFIIIYDTVKNTFESLRNPYANIFGGAGIQTAQYIIEKNVEVVITNDIGLNPLRLLQSVDIKVFFCSRKQVVKVVNEYTEGKLPEWKQKTIINLGRKRYRMKRQKRNRNI